MSRRCDPRQARERPISAKVWWSAKRVPPRPPGRVRLTECPTPRNLVLPWRAARSIAQAPDTAGTPVTISAALESIRRFGASLDGRTLAEWGVALRGCLPPSLRGWLLGRDRRLLVRPSGSTAELYLAVGEEREPLGALALTEPTPLPPLGDKAESERQRTVLVLPAADVLRRTVTLPIQVRENLAEVMRYELDRLSPFSSDQVGFDFETRPAGRPDRLTVELALCRRDGLQPWLDRLRELGRPVNEVTWEGAWPKANLLDPAERPPRRIALFRLDRLALAMAVVLAAAVLISPSWQREQLLERNERELRRLRAAAVEVDEVRRALELAREGSVAVLRRKAEEPRMIDMLREFTHALPDHTWIQSLDVQGDEVQLRGESAQATALIELLERSPGIADVTFRSPVTQVAQTGMERFNIALQHVRTSTP